MKTKYLAIGLAVILLNFVGCKSDSVNSQVDNNQTMLLGWYLTGSNLESGGDSGTDDLLDFVEGYTSLSAEQQATIDVKVIFGGANKDGWRGTKYADADCIVQDAKDREFGNDSCYTRVDPNGNMGDPKTLQDFISYLDGLGSYDKRMLLFWDHGAAYNGLCNDENYAMDGLTLNELKELLEASNSSFDIIGMDACLMANYSVAETVKNHATYLLASEEYEPGHGWQYSDLITVVGQQKDKDMVTIGKKIVDSYIDSPDHSHTKGKTLSLIELKKVENIRNRFDMLNDTLAYSELSTFKPTAYAVLQAKSYGKSYGGYTVTEDFQGYMDNLALGLPAENASIQAVKNSIKDSIIYSRHQKGMEGSDGMSIVNPFHYGLNIRGNYSDIQSLSEVWKRTVDELVGIKTSDREDPVISNFELNCTNGRGAGTCMDISDNTLVANIHYNLFVDSGTGSYLKINAIDFRESMDDATYLFPDQDNSAYMLCGEREGCSFLPLVYKEELETEDGTGLDVYTMMAVHNGLKAQITLYLYFDDTLNYAEVVTFTSLGVPNRSANIEDSDTIEYELDIYNLDGTRRGKESIPMTIKGIDLDLITLKNLSELGGGMSVKFNVELSDINDNMAFSPIF